MRLKAAGFMKSYGAGLLILAFFAGGVVYAMYGPTPGRREVSRADFGQEWPLTVERGVLKCNRGAVVFETGGRVYNVNGLASMQKLGVPIDPIWSTPKPILIQDPGRPGQLINIAPPKKNISPLIDAGLALCE